MSLGGAKVVGVLVGAAETVFLFSAPQPSLLFAEISAGTQDEIRGDQS